MPDEASGYNEYAWLVANTEGDVAKATRFRRCHSEVVRQREFSRHARPLPCRRRSARRRHPDAAARHSDRSPTTARSSATSSGSRHWPESRTGFEPVIRFTCQAEAILRHAPRPVARRPPRGPHAGQRPAAGAAPRVSARPHDVGRAGRRSPTQVRLIVPDQRGFGASARSTAGEHRPAGRRRVALLDALHVPSRPSSAASRWAATSPSTWRSAIPTACGRSCSSTRSSRPTRPRPVPPGPNWRRRSAGVGQEAVAEAMIPHLLARSDAAAGDPAGPPIEEHLRRTIHASRSRRSPAALAALAARPDMVEPMRGVTCPRCSSSGQKTRSLRRSAWSGRSGCSRGRGC